MTYQSINFSPATQIFCVIALVLCGTVFALFCYFNYDKKFAEVKDKTKANKVFVVLFIITATGVLAATLTDFAIKKDNRNKAAENIITKYNIEKVIWNDYRATAYGDGLAKRSEPNVLVVVNNEQHVYRYEVNRETSEPTLKPVGEYSGRRTPPGPPPESLLKN